VTQNIHGHGITALNTLLEGLEAELLTPVFVFASLEKERYGALADAHPIASFMENEGLTLVLEKQRAEALGLAFDGTFKCISLTIHSSLNAVGLTAAVASRFADKGISANVIAAFYHDHFFVPQGREKDALQALEELKRAAKTAR